MDTVTVKDVVIAVGLIGLTLVIGHYRLISVVMDAVAEVLR